MSRILIFLAFLAPSFAVREIIYNLEVSYFEGKPDGVPKQILGFNHQFPGPTIRAQRYDFLNITITNHIQDGQTTTIHWHGFEQFLSPWEDGARMLMQCDIPQNASYMYRFQANQTGTYWYHAHHTSQYGEGLWGVIIIDNVPEIHNYDGEFLLTLSDWFHLSTHDMAQWYQNTSISKGGMPYPDSSLINGVGYYPCDYALLKGKTCEPSYEHKYPVFEVERGKTYRFRVVNPALIVLYALSIDGHKLETIETDGVDTIRVASVDRVTISTGTRYSFLVKMDGELDQYWIRSWADLSTFKREYPNINSYPEAQFDNPTRLAVLKYKEPIGQQISNQPSLPLTNANAIQGRPECHDQSLIQMTMSNNGRLPEMTPTEIIDGLEYYKDDPIKVTFASPPYPSSQPEENPITLNYMDCHPFSEETAPEYVNQSIVLYIPHIDDPANEHKTGFNNITYDLTTLDKPSFIKMLRNEQQPMGVNPRLINGFGHDYVVELILNDYGDSGHPFHLHGHTFWVMGYGDLHDGPFNETRDRPKLRSGVRKETMAVLFDSWVVLRFRADNPGLWLLHCHMNFHFEAAIGLVFLEGTKTTQELFRDNIPDKVTELCKLNGIYFDNVDESTTQSSARRLSLTAIMHFMLLLLMYLNTL